MHMISQCAHLQSVWMSHGETSLMCLISRCVDKNVKLLLKCFHRFSQQNVSVGIRILVMLHETDHSAKVYSHSFGQLIIWFSVKSLERVTLQLFKSMWFRLQKNFKSSLMCGCIKSSDWTGVPWKLHMLEEFLMFHINELIAHAYCGVFSPLELSQVIDR